MLTWWFAGFHSASAATVSIDHLINNFDTIIVNPVILFMMALAAIVFIWGVAQFIYNVGEGEEGDIADGKQHILWGLIGLLIMVGVYGILHLVINTFGLQGPSGSAITLPQ